MKHSLFAVLAATAAVGLAASAIAADPSAEMKSQTSYKKNGGYETTSSSDQVTAAGTSKSSETKVNVDVDSHGNVDKSVKMTATNDPKGTMNAQKDQSQTEIAEKSNGGYTQTTVRQHKEASGTNIYYKTVTDVDVDKDGNVTSTSTSEKVTDPKGLWNETKTTSKTKAYNGKVVKHTVTH